MNGFINVKVDEEVALDMLMERVAHWTDDDVTTNLYRQMYEHYIEGGCFEGVEFDVALIVDNDYVNYCDVVMPDEDRYAKIKAVFDEQGYGDCSCEDCEGDFIEAYDEESGAFLIRW